MMGGCRHFSIGAAALLCGSLALAPLNPAAATETGPPNPVAAIETAPHGPGIPPAADSLALSLEQAVELAREHNETLLMALADEERARGAVKEAWAGALPNIALQGSYQRNFKKPAFFAPEEFGGGKVEMGSDLEFTGTLRLDQVLYAFGRVGNAIEYARVYEQIAELGVARARSDVVYQTREAYLRVLLLKRIAAIRRLSLEQAQSHLRQVEKEYEQGTASRFELQRAQVEVHNREPERIRAENELILARQDLARILGVPEERALRLTDELSYTPYPINREQAIAEGLRRRPEILALEQRVAGQRKIVSLYAADRLPILNLFGQVMMQGQGTADKPGDPFTEDHRQLSTAVGISLSVPLFDGFRTKGKVQQARAGLRRAEHELAQARKAMRLEITQAVQELESLQREYEAQLATVALAEETYAIAETRFRSGLSTQLELTDAETALDLARTSYAETLYRYNRAIANLERVLGRTARAAARESSEEE